MIPVIDIFAGPGGLGEGFSALLNKKKTQVFKIVLSVEKDEIAHETLTLRSFFRQFKSGNAPVEYYEFVRGKITKEELYKKWPKESAKALQEAWLAELGHNSTSNSQVDIKIEQALEKKKHWILIGGPPCQAYSIVGRSRRRQTILDGSTDKRVELYKQYLRILAYHNPSVFIMENVKGILSAETKEHSIFEKILKDLADPVGAYISENGQNGKQLDCPGYKIYSLIKKAEEFDGEGNPVYAPEDFVIKAEKYGIPQTRHRVILIGIRKDINVIPSSLKETNEIPISKVLSGLPRLRSGLSKIKNDTDEIWQTVVRQIVNLNILSGADTKVRRRIRNGLKNIKTAHKGIGNEFIEYGNLTFKYLKKWFFDSNLKGVCNHISRGHMETDIYRYFYVACFAKVKRRSPKLEDFPEALLPDHDNVKEGVDDRKFADRFRVQLWNKPSKTITSHISKDGHYYIHPDETQCRSFTVREAARIQTFPDLEC